MAGTTIIGRVGVKIYPDTSGFRRDAERELSREERRLEVKVPVRVDKTQAMREARSALRAAQAALKDLEVSLDINKQILSKLPKQIDIEARVKDLDISDAAKEALIHIGLSEEDEREILHRVNRLEDKIEDKEIQLPLELDVEEVSYRRAQQRLAWLSRPRTVPLIPKVDGRAAAAAATAIAALSGARLLGNTLKQLRDLFKNLDKNIPLIAAAANAIGALGAAGLAAGSNLFALSASLAQIALAGLALPGILGGLAIGLAVTAVALKDIKERVPQVVEQWSNLKHVIRDNFWAGLQGPLNNLANVLMPQLSKGLAGAATEMGKFFGAFSNSLATELVGSLAGMFDDLAKSVTVAMGATDGLARIIRILGEQGAGQLPRLAQFFADITNKFAAFLTEAEKSGELTKWINTGIEAIKDLGNVAYQTGRILGGLAHAANEAGGAGLKELGDGLERIANTVNGPTFQKALIGTFTAAHEAMDNISKTSGPALERMFLALSDTLQVILPVVGDTVGTLMRDIADAIAQPDLQEGLRSLFDGIHAAVKTLGPALGPVATALGALFQTLGVAAETFAPIITVALEALSDMVVEMAGPIQSLVKTLGGAFLGVLEELAPVFVDIAREIGPVLALLGGDLAKIIKDITPGLGALAQSLGTFLVQAFEKLGPPLLRVLDALAPVAVALGEQLVDALTKLLPMLSPLIDTLGEALLTALVQIVPLLPDLVESFIELLDTITPLLPKLIPLATELLKLAIDILPILVDALPKVVDSLGKLLDLVSGGLGFLNQMGVAANLVGTAIDQLGFVVDGVITIFDGFFEMLKGFADTVIGIFSGDTDRIAEGFRSIWKGFGDIVAGAMEIVLNGVLSGLNLLERTFPGWTQSGEDLVNGIKDGIRNAIDTVVNAIKDVGNALINAFRSLLGIHSPSTVFRGFGQNIIEGLVNGIEAVVGRVTSAMRDAGERVKDAFDGAGSWLSRHGREIIDGLVNGIRDSFYNISSAVGQIPNEINWALGYVGNILYSAGSSVIDGFVSGIRNAFWRVQSTLSELTWMLPDWKGPREVDRKILFDAGRLIIGGLIDGLESEYSSVEDSLNRLTDRIAGQEFESPDIKVNRSSFGRAVSANTEEQAIAGARDGSPTVVVQNYNPVAEPASETTNKVMQTLALLEI